MLAKVHSGAVYGVEIEVDSADKGELLQRMMHNGSHATD